MRFSLKLFVLFLYVPFAQAQTVAETKDGRNVILNNNGTWIYADSLCNYFTHTKTYADGKSVTYANNSIKINGEQGKSGLEVTLLKTSQSVVLNIAIVSPEIWCTDENTKAIIVFTDGKKIELANMGGKNCKGLFSCFLSPVMGNKKELERLIGKSIKTITISYAINNSETTETNTVETLLTKGEAFRIKTIMECLSQQKP